MAPPSTADQFPPDEAFETSLVTIEVGTADTKRTFEVRKGILCFYSGYFASALNGRFAESDDNTCCLPEEDPIIFEMFQHWIHTRTLYESTLDPASLLSYLTIAKLWVFADAHHVPALQNCAIDVFARKLDTLRRSSLSKETGQYILENTFDGSPLRRLVREVVLHPLSDLWHSRNASNFEAVVELLPWSSLSCPWFGGALGGSLRGTALCKAFHTHEDGQCCYEHEVEN